MGHKQRDVAFLMQLRNAGRISEWERGIKMPGSVNLIKLRIIYRRMIDEMYSDLTQALRQEILLREDELRKLKEARSEKR